MTIVEKLSTYYNKSQRAGYIPSSVGVSNEEYDEYAKILADIATDCQLVHTDKPTKLSYLGMELKKYGKRHTDKIKRTAKQEREARQANRK